MSVIHRGSIRFNLALFAFFIGLAIVLGLDLPDRYPTRFDAAGRPSAWAEGPGTWILLVAVGILSFGKLILFQRFLVNDPNSSSFNPPHKELFRQLSPERKAPLVRRANRMLGLITAGSISMASAVLLLIYFSARAPGSSVARIAGASLWVLLVVTLIVPIIEIIAIRRMVRATLIHEGLLTKPTG